MYTATAGALKAAADRANAPNKTNMTKQNGVAIEAAVCDRDSTAVTKGPAARQQSDKARHRQGQTILQKLTNGMEKGAGQGM